MPSAGAVQPNSVSYLCYFCNKYEHTSLYANSYTLYALLRVSTVCGIVLMSRRTSVVSALAAVGSLTWSRQRVPQGADGRVLDPQRRTHKQQHRLPGALHPAPPSGSTSFTLTPPGKHRDTHNEISFRYIFSASYMCSSHSFSTPAVLY